MKPALVFFAVSIGCAQISTPITQARPLLQSARLRDKAWGAWLAGASRDPAMRDALLEQLRQAQALRFAAFGSEEYAVVQTLFDALIGIGAPVASDVILPFENSWRAEVLILMSRSAVDSVTEYALLDMREHPMSDSQWIAVNDLLFAASSKAFFQKTLEEIRITHRFVVVDSASGFALGCGGAFACGSGVGRGPASYPPASPYRLVASMKPGDVLLVAGPVPVYYRQGVADCEASSGSDRQMLLARFFTGLAADQAEKVFHPSTSVQTGAQMEQALATQAASIRAIVAGVLQRGLVQASGMRMPVEVIVEDLRGNRTTSLPVVAAREIVFP